MNPWRLLVVAVVSLSYIGLTECAGVLALAAGSPASLLVGLPFTIAGISSGTLAALGALKLLAATALALSYTGASVGGRGYDNKYNYGYGGGGYEQQQGGYEQPGYEQQGYYSQQQQGYETYTGGHQVYKREAVDNQLGNLDLYFHIINEVDTNSCALRLICELESSKKKGLLDDEKMILGLFGPKPKEVTLESLKTPSGPYHFAAYLGSTATAEQCSKFYGRCPYSSSNMMKALRSATNQP